MYMYLPYSTNLTSYCTAPSPLHRYLHVPVCLSACLRHATPRHSLLYSTRARATPDCLLRRPAWGIPSGSSLVWNFGRDTHTHTPRHAFASAGDRTEKELLHRLVGMYLPPSGYVHVIHCRAPFHHPLHHLVPVTASGGSTG